MFSTSRKKTKAKIRCIAIVITSTMESIIQNGNRTEIVMNYMIINTDDTNDFIEVNYPGHGCDNQDKGIGKAISYS